MGVDTTQIDGHGTCGVVEFGSTGQAGVGPGGLVPSVGDQHFFGGGCLSGGTDGGEQVGGVADLGEVESGQVQSGVGGVDVGVDERGRDERPVEVDDLGVRVQRTAVTVLADPDDDAVGDGHGGGVGRAGCVDTAAHEEGRVAATHAPESATFPSARSFVS